MTDDDITPSAGATAEASAAAAASAGSGQAPDGAPGDAERLSQLEAEKTDLKERLLRSLAEMENLRRRTERDVADARTYAVTGFARDMLTVADNVRRALESVPAGEAGAGAFNPLIEGMELTERDLLKTLERHGVKRLDPQGAKFDPNMHQAMFEVPNEEMPAGTVVQVVQTGYAIGERVLRPALVGVAKGGPKAAPSEAAAGAERA